ncbi:MAG: redox-sensing transcriptional repressor Rex [Gracilibacteraceae bacterium]|nr:redox-sensing transcriptional repressor Rex [Gracilibacteraceae bacterium]
MKIVKIPMATVSRLSIYSRYLIKLADTGTETVSSGGIADSVGVTPAQVRKDLAYFGEFGVRGVGYHVKDLISHIRNILNLNNEWRLALVGAGRLGRALTMYKGFRERGFVIDCVFDSDPEKIGGVFEGMEILASDRIREVARRQKADIGVICVPAAQAQDVADALVDSGVKAILNFAPMNLTVPMSIHVQNVDLAMHLEVLAFQMGEGRHA